MNSDMIVIIINVSDVFITGIIILHLYIKNELLMLETIWKDNVCITASHLNLCASCAVIIDVRPIYL